MLPIALAANQRTDNESDKSILEPPSNVEVNWNAVNKSNKANREKYIIPMAIRELPFNVAYKRVTLQSGPSQGYILTWLFRKLTISLVNQRVTF